MTYDELLQLKCDDLYTTQAEVYWQGLETAKRQRATIFSENIVALTRGANLFTVSGATERLVLTKVTSSIYFTGSGHVMVMVLRSGEVHLVPRPGHRDTSPLCTAPLDNFDTIHDIVKWSRMVVTMMTEEA